MTSSLPVLEMLRSFTARRFGVEVHVGLAEKDLARPVPSMLSAEFALDGKVFGRHRVTLGQSGRKMRLALLAFHHLIRTFYGSLKAVVHGHNPVNLGEYKAKMHPQAKCLILREIVRRAA